MEQRGSRSGVVSQQQRQYRGIRMRRWGKWVSEIRDPVTRTRIWLGSFRSAEEAAHAYDAAIVCLRGPNSQPNFPHHTPTIPSGTPGYYSRREIQAAAAASAAAAVGRPFNYNEFMSPKASDMSDESGESELLEDITYTEEEEVSGVYYQFRESGISYPSPHYHSPLPPPPPPPPPPSCSHSSNHIFDFNNNWSCNVDDHHFDDPYEREWVHNIIFPSTTATTPNDDYSEDHENSFVEPCLWSYER